MAAVRHKRYCQEAFTGHHVTPSLRTGHHVTSSLRTGHHVTPSLRTGHHVTSSLRTFVVTRNGGSGNSGGTKKARLDQSISDDSCYESPSTFSSGSFGSIALTDSLFRFHSRKPNESSLSGTQTQTLLSSPYYQMKPNSDESYQMKPNSDESYQMKPNSDESYQMKPNSDESYQMKPHSDESYQMKPNSDESIIREVEEEEDERSISNPSRSETSTIPMNGREPDESSLKDESNSTGRRPSCAACRNHGVTVALKGHKRHCKFVACVCDKCLLTRERRTVMANSVKMTRNLKQDMEEGLGYFDPEPVTELNVQDDDSVNSKLDYSTISKSQVKNVRIERRIKRRSIPFRGGTLVYDENLDESTITISKFFFEDLINSYWYFETLFRAETPVAPSLHHCSPPCDTSDSSPSVPLSVPWMDLMARQWNMSQQALQKPVISTQKSATITQKSATSTQTPAISTIIPSMKKAGEHVLPPISHPNSFPLSNVLLRSSCL